VKSLNVIEHVGPGFIPGAVPAMMNPLAFEYPEESLTRGVVAAMTYSTHTADQSVLTQEPLVVAACGLAATIGM
jgi:hypothetical protein